MLAAPATATVTTTAVIASIAGQRASADTRVKAAAGPPSFDEATALSAEFNGVGTDRNSAANPARMILLPTEAQRWSIGAGLSLYLVEISSSFPIYLISRENLGSLDAKRAGLLLFSDTSSSHRPSVYYAHLACKGAIDIVGTEHSMIA